MHRANAAPGSRSQAFNSLYAYHRALLFVLVAGIALLVASMTWGAAQTWPTARSLVLLVVFAALLVLVWYRSKQRALYYVREVLGVAEREVDPSVSSDRKRAGVAAREG